jgi:hypothetical protein
MELLAMEARVDVKLVVEGGHVAVVDAGVDLVRPIPMDRVVHLLSVDEHVGDIVEEEELGKNVNSKLGEEERVQAVREAIPRTVTGRKERRERRAVKDGVAGARVFGVICPLDELASIDALDRRRRGAEPA